MDHRPDQFHVDTHVVVGNLVPHPGDLSPWNTGSCIAEVRREVLHRLSDDFEAPDDSVLDLLAVAECDEVDFGNVGLNQLDAFEDVYQIQRGIRWLHRILSSS